MIASPIETPPQFKNWSGESWGTGAGPAVRTPAFRSPETRMARARRHAASLEPVRPVPIPTAATTPDDVRAWLVAFFTDLPNVSIYAAGRGQAAFLDPDKSPSALDWPALTAEVLGPRSRERLYVLTWARCAARRRAIAKDLPNPPAGGTVAEFCAEFGVSRRTFEHSIRRSFAILAAEWDRRHRSGTS